MAEAPGREAEPVRRPWRRLDRLLRLGLAGLWIASLLLPAAWSHDTTGQWNHYDGPIYGWEILAFGWLAVIEGQFGWFANPLLIPALLLPETGPSPRRWSVWLGVTIALALCFAGGLAFTHNNISFGPEWNTPYGPGRWLWLTAVGGATARLAWLLFLSRPRNPAS